MFLLALRRLRCSIGSKEPMASIIFGQGAISLLGAGVHMPLAKARDGGWQCVGQLLNVASVTAGPPLPLQPSCAR